MSLAGPKPEDPPRLDDAQEQVHDDVLAAVDRQRFNAPGWSPAECASIRAGLLDAFQLRDFKVPSSSSGACLDQPAVAQRLTHCLVQHALTPRFREFLGSAEGKSLDEALQLGEDRSAARAEMVPAAPSRQQKPASAS